MKTIYAFTGKSPAVGYVGYINVRQHANGIAFTVRSEGDGKQGEIILTPEQCEELAVDLLAFINEEAGFTSQLDEALAQIACLKTALQMTKPQPDQGDGILRFDGEPT